MINLNNEKILQLKEEISHLKRDRFLSHTGVFIVGLGIGIALTILTLFIW